MKRLKKQFGCDIIALLQTGGPLRSSARTLGFFKEEATMDMLKAFTNEQLKEQTTPLNIGDTVKVHCRIKDGNNERIQIFEGTIIAKKGGGISETFTVRKIAYGVGVEKIFPVHSPNVAKVEIVRRGKVRRAKLYYIRGRVGRSSKVKELI